jgi:hypothetical protein
MHYIFLTLATLLRLIPHPWNMTPIPSIGLFAGSWCDRRVAWMMPLIPLLIGDLITGGYNPLIMVFVYTGMALSAVIGRLLLSRKRNLLRFAGAITTNALLFYLLSNFPVWWVYYQHSITGLIECYLKAIPFLGYSMLGDSLFVTLIFGTHYLAQKSLGFNHANQAT